MVAKLYGVLVTYVDIKVLSNLKIGQTKQIKNIISLHFQTTQPSNQRACLYLYCLYCLCSLQTKVSCTSPHQ